MAWGDKSEDGTNEGNDGTAILENATGDRSARLARSLREAISPCLSDPSMLESIVGRTVSAALVWNGLAQTEGVCEGVFQARQLLLVVARKDWEQKEPRFWMADQVSGKEDTALPLVLLDHDSIIRLISN